MTPDPKMLAAKAQDGGTLSLYEAYLRKNVTELQEAVTACAGDAQRERWARAAHNPLSEDGFRKMIDALPAAEKAEYERELLGGLEAEGPGGGPPVGEGGIKPIARGPVGRPRPRGPAQGG